jgi:hypothetical protein
MRPLRARLVTSHSGGSGTPLGRHYGRSARSSLHWPARMRVQETRPGADGVALTGDANKCRDGALRGERAGATARGAARRRLSQGASRRSIPSAFSPRAHRPHNSGATRRENEGACPDGRRRKGRQKQRPPAGEQPAAGETHRRSGRGGVAQSPPRRCQGWRRNDWAPGSAASHKRHILPV